MDCPKCGYALTAFDKECLRCKRAAAEAFVHSPAAIWPPPIGDQTPTPPPPILPPSYVAPPIRYQDDSQENTSGGEYGVPMEVAELHWNWGAFFLGWLWCFANGVAGLGVLLLALDCLLTFFNVALLPAGYALPSELLALVVVGTHCYLGLHGHPFAWERRRFVGGVAQFFSVQRAWATAGVIAFVGTTLVFTIFGVLFMSAFQAYEARRQQPAPVVAPPPAETGPAPVILQANPPAPRTGYVPIDGRTGMPIPTDRGMPPGGFQHQFNPNYRSSSAEPGYRQPGDQALGYRPAPPPSQVTPDQPPPSFQVEPSPQAPPPQPPAPTADPVPPANAVPPTDTPPTPSSTAPVAP